MPSKYRQKIQWALIFIVFSALLCGCEEPEAFDLSTLIPAPDTYDVRIIRDSWGVPHIYGKTDADVAYGLA